jgi:hypothetical protein
VLISTESEIQVTQKQTGVFLFGCELWVKFYCHILNFIN